MSKPRAEAVKTAKTNPYYKIIRDRILFHIKYSRCKTWEIASDFDKMVSLSQAVRDLAVDRMIATQKKYQDMNTKRVYYLSMEFLMGRALINNIVALDVWQAAKDVIYDLGMDLDALADIEDDEGLGNGGLGRLAACFLDSMATMELPAYGYGLRYQYGIFRQELHNGWQMEYPNDWLKYGSPWEMVRPEYTVPVLCYGKLEYVKNTKGEDIPVWLDWQMLEGVPFDFPIIGFQKNTVNILRLWSSRATEGFRLDVFNQGEYVRAVEQENWAETITKVLYPSDNTSSGKELRLLQEYFLVACSVHDIIRRYQKSKNNWNNFSLKNAVQLNDTHPALAIAEFMRHLLDEAKIPWNKAWDITRRTFAYTNHTLMPEALEKWPVPMLERVLPRHMKLIYDINMRFLNSVEVRFPDDPGKTARMSLIEESNPKQVRMANLAIVGSHAVNGVSKLHTDLLKKKTLADFAEMWPGKFSAKTNGISQRRWLLVCNPGLSSLITERIGDKWTTDLNQLKKLEHFIEDGEFLAQLREVKKLNKIRLAQHLNDKFDILIDTASIFDVHVKRLHEYKRQLLNVMHIITLYRRLKNNPDADIIPRTFIFGAKAAPGYQRAKLIIKLINSVAETIRGDKAVRDRLNVVFVPDYKVSNAEIIIPAADLSEQISTAGTEASGTGNMKLALNGALTIGTWDGANIEIAQAVGSGNIFIFGKRAEKLEELRSSGTYDPAAIIRDDEELADVITTIEKNEFSRNEPGLFNDIVRSLREEGDHYFHLADYRSYIECQERAAALYADPEAWSKKAALNIARMGKFSSDRTIGEYAGKIWKVKPVKIRCIKKQNNLELSQK